MSHASQVSRPVAVAYAQKSEVENDAERSRVILALDGSRGEVGIRGEVADGALFRDSLMTAVTVLGSDLRYRGKDRTAYLAYLAKQGKKATAAIWEAQKSFLDEAFADDRQKITTLDPLLSVHPDEVSLEVFSKDESAYLRLCLGNNLFEKRQAAHGTTFVELGPEVIAGLDRLRGYAKVSLDAGLRPEAKTKGEPLDKALDIPYTFLRGFLQVQTAATLPSVSCELAPIDLYNLLFALRTRKTKKSPRALRFELVPGAPPRLVLEPWEIVLEGHGPVYAGKTPRVVRTFGRQRLLSLSRALPHLKGVSVHLLGPGLPVFWVLDMGTASLILGLTGWTESGWSSAASFDALMPSDAGKDLAGPVLALLKSQGPSEFSAIAKEVAATTQAAKDKLRTALKLLCLRGQALYDLRTGCYRPRDLFNQPVDELVIRYGNQREAQAHRLLGDGKAAEGEVRLTKIHDLAGEGVEIHGEVTDKEARRTYVPGFTLDLEGRSKDATCGCPIFRRSGMREGPCEHLIALRLFYGRKRVEEEARRLTEEGRKLIRAETRTLTKRDEHGDEIVYRVSLDDKVVRLIWGQRQKELQKPGQPDSMRQQRLWFDTDREAREAYFSKLERLSADGFIDADAF